MSARCVLAAADNEPRFTNNINVTVPHISTDKSVAAFTRPQDRQPEPLRLRFAVWMKSGLLPQPLCVAHSGEEQIDFFPGDDEGATRQ